MPYRRFRTGYKIIPNSFDVEYTYIIYETNTGKCMGDCLTQDKVNKMIEKLRREESQIQYDKVITILDKIHSQN